jgi:hypothetical protein
VVVEAVPDRYQASGNNRLTANPPSVSLRADPTSRVYQTVLSNLAQIRTGRGKT